MVTMVAGARSHLYRTEVRIGRNWPVAPRRELNPQALRALLSGDEPAARESKTLAKGLGKTPKKTRKSRSPKVGREASPRGTCVCSKITILFGTSGSIRQTLPASPPTRLSAISKLRLLKCCGASMSFSASREPTNHGY